MKYGAFAFSIIFSNTLYFKGVKTSYYGVKGYLAYVIALKAQRKKNAYENVVCLSGLLQVIA